MSLLDRVARHSHIISDHFILSKKMFSFDTPTNSSRYARDRVHHIRFIIYCTLLWAHLFAEESGKGWLEDPRLWIIYILFKGLLESLLNLLVDLKQISLIFLLRCVS